MALFDLAGISLTTLSLSANLKALQNPLLYYDTFSVYEFSIYKGRTFDPKEGI